MFKFKSLEDMIYFCEKHRLICRLSRKTIYKTTARLYMKSAGYLNFGKFNIEKLYEELKEVSQKNGIHPTNPLYLSIKHPKIAKYVLNKSSPELKQFIQYNDLKPKAFTVKKSKLGSQDLIPLEIKHAKTLNF